MSHTTNICLWSAILGIKLNKHCALHRTAVICILHTGRFGITIRETLRKKCFIITRVFQICLSEHGKIYLFSGNFLQNQRGKKETNKHLLESPLLKTLDTIGDCQKPVFSIDVAHHMHKLTNLWKFELNWSSKLQDNNERKNTLVTQSFVLSDAWFRDLKF